MSTRPCGKSSRPQSALNAPADRQRIGSDRVQSSACSRVSLVHSGSGISCPGAVRTPVGFDRRECTHEGTARMPGVTVSLTRHRHECGPVGAGSLADTISPGEESRHVERRGRLRASEHRCRRADSTHEGRSPKICAPTQPPAVRMTGRQPLAFAPSDRRRILALRHRGASLTSPIRTRCSSLWLNSKRLPYLATIRSCAGCPDSQLKGCGTRTDASIDESRHVLVSPVRIGPHLSRCATLAPSRLSSNARVHGYSGEDEARDHGRGADAQAGIRRAVGGSDCARSLWLPAGIVALWWSGLRAAADRRASPVWGWRWHR